MLRDETLDALLARLDEDDFATLRIRVDNGLYRASYAIGVTPTEGSAEPVLTDALVSLERELRRG